MLYEVMKSYQQRVMTNIHRSAYVEAIVTVALVDHGWKRMSPWSSWDLEHIASRTRLEVKQAAAVQSWGGDRTSPVRFDIASRTGYWDNDDWVPKPGRPAHIYIFAWHGDPGEIADQRDPHRWEFYVIAERDLPQQKTIGLGVIRRIGEMRRGSRLGDLAAAVEAAQEQEAKALLPP